MQLSKISKEMKQCPLVFIVGGARSGTSMLYRTLQKHSAFMPKKINLQETHILSYSNRSHLFTNNDPRNLIEYMLEDEFFYGKFLESIRSIQLIHRLKNFPISSHFTNRLLWWWYINLNHIMLRAFFYYASKARGCNRLIEKTPHNIRNVPNLLLAFPKCKLLYMYRHPIDVYTSYVRRGRIEIKASWTHLSPKAFCNLYEKSMTLALHFESKRKDSFLLVSYEDFTQDPTIVFRRICNFIGEPFEQEAIIERNPDLNLWKIDPHLFGNITPKTKDWMEYISKQDAQYIESNLASTIKRLNYQHYSKSY